MVKYVHLDKKGYYTTQKKIYIWFKIFAPLICMIYSLSNNEYKLF